MIRLKRRLKDHKKAVHPVIAVIILIAVTLVLSLVVGAYAFGLFGSNVKTVTLTSGNLFAGNIVTSVNAGTANASGNAYISFSLNNPGAETSITSFTLTGSSLTAGAFGVYCVSGTGGTCSAVSSSAPTPLAAGKVTPLTLYFATSASGAKLTSGQTYNYVMNLGNGQSVSGSLIAQ